MKPSQLVTALEDKRELLREFTNLSSQHLQLSNEQTANQTSLTKRRSDLMLELWAIDSTIETWIDQVRNALEVSSDVLRELRFLSNDVVRLANEVIAIDEQTDPNFELIEKLAS